MGMGMGAEEAVVGLSEGLSERVAPTEELTEDLVGMALRKAAVHPAAAAKATAAAAMAVAAATAAAAAREATAAVVVVGASLVRVGERLVRLGHPLEHRLRLEVVEAVEVVVVTGGG